MNYYQQFIHGDKNWIKIHNLTQYNLTLKYAVNVAFTVWYMNMKLLAEWLANAIIILILHNPPPKSTRE